MIRVENLSFTYPNMDSLVLEDLSFKIEREDFMAILGENGGGKSTLIKCINRINPAYDGQIIIDGKNQKDYSPKELAVKMAYVGQEIELYNTTVYDYLALGRRPHISWDLGTEDKRIIQEEIIGFELEDLVPRRLDELSGGEAQKVALARAMIQRPEILILDEPTSSLDIKNQKEIMDRLVEVLEERKLSILMVIHDINLALQYCDKFLLLKNSQVFSFGSEDIITEDEVTDLFEVQCKVLGYQNRKVVITK